jgi:acetyl esterase/lipase
MLTSLRRSVILWVAGLFLFSVSCVSFVQAIGVKFIFKKTGYPDDRVYRAVQYFEGDGADPVRHTLDLFVPEGKGWPVLVFAYGGGWTTGEKGLQVGGADIYGNIGRFYAARGIGVAVIDYRLIPVEKLRGKPGGVTLADQILDGTRAVAWVYQNIATYGGDPRRLYLAGHSAGAQLMTHVALDARRLRALGLNREIVRGVVAVSGAAYDLIDPVTIELDNGENQYFERRFRDGPEDRDWQRRDSVLPHVHAKAPPFLILYGEDESESLKRQSLLLHGALQSAGGRSQIVIVPTIGHKRIVLTMSQNDTTVSNAILAFIKPHH